MLGTGSPADAVVLVELDTCLTLLLVKNLKAIIVDENVGRSTLKLIGSHRSLERLHCWRNDGCETLFVYRALNGDVGELSSDATGQERGVVPRVGLHLTNGTNHLCDTTNNDLCEEQREEDLDGDQDQKGDSNVVLVDHDLNGDLLESETQHDRDNDESESDEDTVHDVCGANLWLVLASLLINLGLDDRRALLLVEALLFSIRLTGLPDELHQLIFDVYRSGEDSIWVVVPNKE